MRNNNKGEIIIYNTEDGQTKVEVVFSGETVWLTQDQMSELFGKAKSTINEHLKNIFADGELTESEVMTKFGFTEFNRQRPTQYYNLNAVLAVGYRVNSQRGIQFRKWASAVLTEYMKKGFVMNDDLLKENGGGNYFDELLERIRDIRSSEKVFYRKILDIYATSIDYNPKAETTLDFFKLVQNKMHYATHGRTAPELIFERANAQLPFMGLTSFKGQKPRENEIVIAKNYLTVKEIEQLNSIVSAYLEFAEMQAKSRKPMYMKDWIVKLDTFLSAGDKDILITAGKISHETAIEHAKDEYGKYKVKTQDELTQVEKDFIKTVDNTYKLLEQKDRIKPNKM
jgi:hypothetical protein